MNKKILFAVIISLLVLIGCQHAWNQEKEKFFRGILTESVCVGDPDQITTHSFEIPHYDLDKFCLVDINKPGDIDIPVIVGAINNNIGHNAFLIKNNRIYGSFYVDNLFVANGFVCYDLSNNRITFTIPTDFKAKDPNQMTCPELPSEPVTGRKPDTPVNRVIIFVEDCVNQTLFKKLETSPQADDIELAEYIDNNLNVCLNNFESFNDVSIEVLGNIQSEVTSSDKSVSVKVSYPLRIKLNDSVVNINTFYVMNQK